MNDSYNKTQNNVPHRGRRGLHFINAHGMLVMVMLTKMKIKTKNIITKGVHVSLVGLLVAGSFIAMPLVRADEFQQRIDELKAENGQTRQVVNELEAQAQTYQGVIDDLQRQIGVLQEQIATNERQRNDLIGQIAAAEAELARQKDILGQSIKTMYLEGEISTLEMLATSKDLNEFVDKQQYRESVQNKIKTTVDKITELKIQLDSQKQAIDRLIAEQTTLSNTIESNKAEQQRLLAFTESQKTEYTAKIKDNESKIADLRAQQIAANARNSIGSRVGSPTNGFYPYDNWPFSMRGPGCIDGDGPDRWGYCTRQCVSYVAWAVERSGRNAPMYYGNANRWDDIGSRFIVSNPQPGDVAVSNYGTWGHVMYVEAVGEKNGRSAIYISQYNAGLDGRYSEEWKYASGYVYLRFP